LNPRIKNVENAFQKKLKNVRERLKKNVHDKCTKLFKANKKFSSNITVLVRELWLFVREFPIAAVVNP